MPPIGLRKYPYTQSRIMTAATPSHIDILLEIGGLTVRRMWVRLAVCAIPKLRWQDELQEDETGCSRQDEDCEYRPAAGHMVAH